MRWQGSCTVNLQGMLCTSQTNCRANPKQPYKAAPQVFPCSLKTYSYTWHRDFPLLPLWMTTCQYKKQTPNFQMASLYIWCPSEHSWASIACRKLTPPCHEYSLLLNLQDRRWFRHKCLTCFSSSLSTMPPCCCLLSWSPLWVWVRQQKPGASKYLWTAYCPCISPLMRYKAR